jgi:hypothetical protein
MEFSRKCRRLCRSLFLRAGDYGVVSVLVGHPVVSSGHPAVDAPCGPSPFPGCDQMVDLHPRYAFSRCSRRVVIAERTLPCWSGFRSMGA